MYQYCKDQQLEEIIMYTIEQLALLRAADPGVVLPGVDTSVGNPIPTASLWLIPLSQVAPDVVMAAA